jgi:hypothetical protein
VHCWGVIDKTINWHHSNVLCSWEGDESGRETQPPCSSTAWSIIKVKIIGHIQQNQHHSLSPSLADKHRNSASCRVKWWLAQVEEEKVQKYACKNTRPCNDAIKFSIKYILQSTEIPQASSKHAWNTSRVLPGWVLFHVYAFLVFLDFKSSQHYKCMCVNKWNCNKCEFWFNVIIKIRLYENSTFLKCFNYSYNPKLK